MFICEKTRQNIYIVKSHNDNKRILWKIPFAVFQGKMRKKMENYEFSIKIYEFCVKTVVFI